MYGIWSSEGKRKQEAEKISEEIMAKICPHLMRSLNPICLESQRTKAGLA